jgi:hypothetical protein
VFHWALVKSPTTRIEATTITDPELIREVLRLYPAPAAPTGGFQLESGEQLELDFNAPRVVEQPEPDGTPPLIPVTTGGFQLESGEQLELDFNAPPEPELQALLEDTDQLELDFEAAAPESTKANLNALSAILARDPVLNFLRAVDPKRKGFAASVQQISDGEWSAAGNALDEAYEFVAELGDSEPLLTKAALDALGPILFKYDTGTPIRKNAAAKSARRNQGPPAPSPAPTAAAAAPAPVAPTPAPAPTATPAPTPTPAPAPVAKKAAKKEAPAERPKVTKKFIDDSLATAAKLEANLLKANTRGDKLDNRSKYVEIIKALDVFGFKLADLPPEFLVRVNAVQDNPADIDKLFAMLFWADSTLNPTPAPAPEPTPAAEPITWISLFGTCTFAEVYSAAHSDELFAAMPRTYHVIR